MRRPSRRTLLRASLPLLAVLLVAGCAQTVRSVPESGLVGGLHLRGGVGATVLDPGRSDPSSIVDVDETALSWDVAAGWRLFEYAGLEVGYADLGSYDYKGTVGEESLDGKIEARGFKASVLGYYPVTDDLDAFAEVGAFRWESEDRGTFAGISAKEDDDGTDLLFGAGFQGRLVGPLDLGLRWTHYMDVADGDFDVFALTLAWYPFR
jgi:hypothetical protein